MLLRGGFFLPLSFPLSPLPVLLLCLEVALSLFRGSDLDGIRGGDYKCVFKNLGVMEQSGGGAFLVPQWQSSPSKWLWLSSAATDLAFPGVHDLLRACGRAVDLLAQWEPEIKKQCI